jgi:hypothetical protein
MTDLEQDLYIANARIKELEAENEKLKEANRWIPVAERLPEEWHYPPVLCGHVSDDWSDAAIVTDQGKFINAEGCEIYPTHWRPLPEPPKEGAEK